MALKTDEPDDPVVNPETPDNSGDDEPDTPVVVDPVTPTPPDNPDPVGPDPPSPDPEPEQPENPENPEDPDNPDPVDPDTPSPNDPEPGKPVNPNTTVEPESCDSFWCKYKWYIIGGSCGLVVLILAIIIIWLCCRGRSTKQSEARAEVERAPTKSSRSIHNEHLVTETTVVDDKISKEFEKNLRFIQEDFKGRLHEKELHI